MTLIKTSLLNAIAVAVKMLTLLALNKILAIYVGPAGYAAIGNFQNALQVITTLGGSAINNGVTKYTAEYYADEEQLNKVWRTAGSLVLISSLITGVILVFFNRHLSRWFLDSELFGSVFIWFGVTLVFFIFNNLLIAILNGKKDIGRYIRLNIFGSIFSILIVTLLVVGWGLYGALLAMAINQSLVFFVTLIMCYRTPWFRFSNIIGRIDKGSAINLAKFSAMAITSAACIPITHMMIRSLIIENLGLDAAGHWEAMWRLSTAYLIFITTTLSFYYLPRLSELESFSDIRREIVSGYKLIIPLTALAGLLIYLLRDVIIALLFTSEFSSMRTLFAWQMIGDTLKIGGWILAYLMIGKAMVSFYIFTEILFSFLFYFVTLMLFNRFGLQAPVIAHAIHYALYWVTMFFLLRKFIWSKNNDR